MTIHNPDNLPEGIIAEAIQMMRRESPKRTITEITVKRTATPEEYSITPIFAKVPFERIRRITGYLTGNADTWNAARQAELRDRVAHAGGSE